MGQRRDGATRRGRKENSQLGPRMAYYQPERWDAHLPHIQNAVMGVPSEPMAATASHLQWPSGPRPGGSPQEELHLAFQLRL